MLTYKNWKALNESITLGGPLTLGLKSHAGFDFDEAKKKMGAMVPMDGEEEEVADDEDMGDEEEVDDEEMGDEKGCGDEEMGDEEDMEDEKSPMFMKKCAKKGMKKKMKKESEEGSDALTEMKKKMSKHMCGKCSGEKMSEEELAQAINAAENTLNEMKKKFNFFKKKKDGDKGEDKGGDKDNKFNFFKKKGDKKDDKKDETQMGYHPQSDAEWMASVQNMIGVDHNQKGWDGISVSEEALIPPTDPNAGVTEPVAGQVGFAPTGRIGSL